MFGGGNSLCYCTEFGWLEERYLKTYIYFHFLIKTIIHDQTMGHSNPVRLHWMPGDVGIVANVRVVKVSYTFLVITIGKGLIKRGERCHEVRFVN